MMNVRLLEQIDIVAGLNNVDLNTTAAGDYVSLKNYSACLIIVLKAAGTAGDDISLQLFQAQDVAGTGEKALVFNDLYHKIGTQTGIGTFTRVRLTTPTADLDTVSVNGADLLADDVAAMFVLDIRASSLDVTNRFDCICFKNDGADLGSAAQGTVLYIPYGASYPQAAPLSSIID